MIHDDGTILDEGFAQGTGPEDALDAGAGEAVLRAATWARYYLYVVAGYLAITVVIQLLGLARGGDVGPGGETVGLGLAGALAGLIMWLIIMGLAFGYPLYRLWGFSQLAPRALAEQNQEALVESVSNIRSTFKYLGVATAIILGFYAVILIGALLFGGIAALS